MKDQIDFSEEAKGFVDEPKPSLTDEDINRKFDHQVQLDVDVYWVAKSFHFSEGLMDELEGVDPAIRKQILNEDDNSESIDFAKFNTLAEKRNKKMLEMLLEW